MEHEVPRIPVTVQVGIALTGLADGEREKVSVDAEARGRQPEAHGGAGRAVVDELHEVLAVAVPVQIDSTLPEFEDGEGDVAVRHADSARGFQAGVVHRARRRIDDLQHEIDGVPVGVQIGVVRPRLRAADGHEGSLDLETE